MLDRLGPRSSRTVRLPDHLPGLPLDLQLERKKQAKPVLKIHSVGPGTVCISQAKLCWSHSQYTSSLRFHSTHHFNDMLDVIVGFEPLFICTVDHFPERLTSRYSTVLLFLIFIYNLPNSDASRKISSGDQSSGNIVQSSKVPSMLPASQPTQGSTELVTSMMRSSLWPSATHLLLFYEQSGTQSQ